MVHFLSIRKFDLPQSLYSGNCFVLFKIDFFLLIVNGNEDDERDSKGDVYQM